MCMSVIVSTEIEERKDYNSRRETENEGKNR